MPIQAGPPGHATISGRIPRVEKRAAKQVRVAFPTRIDAPNPQTWHHVAACRDADPELFFAPDYERARDSARRETEALAICAGCPVRVLCLNWATEAGEKGIWGGTTDTDRQRTEQQEARRLRNRTRRVMASAA